MTKPANSVKPVREGQKQKDKKPVVIPKSIKFAAEKTKSRISFAIPGRYILQNRKGMFAIVRISEDTKMSPSIVTKVFKATASDIDLTEDQIFALEPVELDSLSESNQPGPKNSSVGNKLGKKTRAPNVLAKGWWMFRKGKDGKTAKAYIGGRISGRRLLALLDPAQAPKPKTEVVDQIGKKPVVDTKKIAELTKIYKKLGEGIKQAKERLTTLKRATSKISLKAKIKEAMEKRKEIADQIKALKSGVKVEAKPAETKPKVDAKPKATQVKTKADISALSPSQQVSFKKLKTQGTELVKKIKEFQTKMESLKSKPAKAKVQSAIDELMKLKNAIAKKLQMYLKKARDKNTEPKEAAVVKKPEPAKAEPKAVKVKPKAPAKKPEPMSQEKKEAKAEVKDRESKIDVLVEKHDSLKEKIEKIKDPRQKAKLQSAIDAINKRIEINAAKKSGANSRLKSTSAEDIYFQTYSGAVQHAVDTATKKGYGYDQDDYDRIVANNSKKPSAGKTTKFILPLIKEGKRSGLTVAVYCTDANTPKPYELTYYIH
jgi:phage shock protein A